MPGKRVQLNQSHEMMVLERGYAITQAGPAPPRWLGFWANSPKAFVLCDHLIRCTMTLRLCEHGLAGGHRSLLQSEMGENVYTLACSVAVFFGCHADHLFKCR